ncbi:TPR-like protein, partial [Byssothecium circinans]
VPYPHDVNFLGRFAILNLIDEKFATQSCIALSGLGGIGKSQIAIEYSYIFRERHPAAHVFWVYGAHSSRFEKSYQEVSRRLSIPGWDDYKVDNLQLVCDWLQEEPTGNWLFVVDNADDAAMLYGTHGQNHGTSKTYAQYIPSNTKGSILITTRDRRVGERLPGRQRPIEVLHMSSTECVELLRSKIAEEHFDDGDAMHLVQELSHIPLAITQAAAFISENNFTVSEYLETLRSSDEAIKELLSEHLEDPRQDMSTENSVMRTWKLSFEQIIKGASRAGDMLSLLSVLDYHGAPLMLLRQKDETETGFRTALGILQAFSLVTAGRGKNAVCKMHRLVALALHKWLDTRGLLRYRQSEALRILTEKFPGPCEQQFSDWATFEMLTPHTEIVSSIVFCTERDQLQCAKLLVAVTIYHLSKGRYNEAFEMCSKSLEIRRNLLPWDHADTLDSVQTLGETLLHRGDLESAKKMLQRAAEGREGALGADNPDTLESLSDLTITLLELNDIKAAASTSKRALEGREKVLGKHDKNTLVSLNIMAILRQQQGNTSAARAISEEVLSHRERLLGPSHPDTLMTVNNLGGLHYEQGNYEVAKEMFDRALTGEEAVLGGDGYDIQVTLSNIALVQKAQGLCEEAEAILRNVLTIRERKLGLLHPSTLFTMDMLIDILLQRHMWDAAEELQLRVTERRKR